VIVRPWLLKNAELSRKYYEDVRSGKLEDNTARPPKAKWPERPPEKKS
jgi:hypothetical protein